MINKEEIKKAYPYRIELHAHTKPASGCAEIPTEEVLRTFKNDGYDGIAITNHCYLGAKGMNIEQFAGFYRAELLNAIELGEKIGIKVYAGAELRFVNQNDNDYLLFGYDPDDLYYLIQSLYGTLEDFVREYKTDEMFLLQAHPFRKGMELVDTDLLDAVEAFNMHPNHNSRVAVAERYARENGKIMTMGTDFHHENHDNLCATRAPYLPQNEKELIKLLKSEDYIFEIGDKILL